MAAAAAAVFSAAWLQGCVLSPVPVRRGRSSHRRKPCGLIRCSAGQPSSSGDSSALTTALKRKQASVQATLASLGSEEALQIRLEQARAGPSHRLVDLIAERSLQGRTVLVVEASRRHRDEPSEAVAQRCADYLRWGADAIVLCTDEESTADGMKDLRAVCRAARGKPVIRRDWMLHPIQVVETSECDAVAVTLVTAVLNKGLKPMLQYTQNLGVDGVVEVVNMQDLEAAQNAGASLYGINLSVALSLSIPGFRHQMAVSLLEKMPFGAGSIVGVSSVEEAQQMRDARADAVVVKREALDAVEDAPAARILEELAYRLTGDD
eukprot:jgi/Chlat1/6447/Chrsp45S05955